MDTVTDTVDRERYKVVEPTAQEYVVMRLALLAFKGVLDMPGAPELPEELKDAVSSIERKLCVGDDIACIQSDGFMVV